MRTIRDLDAVLASDQLSVAIFVDETELIGTNCESNKRRSATSSNSDTLETHELLIDGW